MLPLCGLNTGSTWVRILAAETLLVTIGMYLWTTKELRMVATEKVSRQQLGRVDWADKGEEGQELSNGRWKKGQWWNKTKGDARTAL